MKVSDFEKLMIGSVIKFSGERDTIREIIVTLSSDKFGADDSSHKFIWEAIESIVISKKDVSIPLIVQLLGGLAETIGGETYLKSLIDYVETLNVQSLANWEEYAGVINNAGKLRHIGLVMDKYNQMYDDFEGLVRNVENVDQFTANFMKDLQTQIKIEISNDLKPIENACNIELEKIEKIQKGEIDVMNVGIPSLMQFGIPYPRSFGVFLGMRSMGKTNAAWQVLLGKSMHLKNNGLEGECTMTSLETPGELLVRRGACMLAGIDSLKLKLNQITSHDWGRYKAAVAYISTLPIMYDDSPVLTSEQMAIKSIAQNLRTSRVLGVSDYAELFSDKSSKTSEEQRVAGIVVGVRSIAWATGSCEILITQVNNSVLLTQSKIAGVDRSRYSGSFAHAADFAIEIWNPIQMAASKINFKCPDDKKPDYAYWLIEKNKNGPLGDIRFNWQPEFTRFYDLKLNTPGMLYEFDIPIQWPERVASNPMSNFDW